MLDVLVEVFEDDQRGERSDQAVSFAQVGNFALVWPLEYEKVFQFLLRPEPPEEISVNGVSS